MSSVLLPFVVAWVLAYMLYPIVNFIQHKLYIRNRTASVIITLMGVVGIISGLCWISAPSIAAEWANLKNIALGYIDGTRHVTGMTAKVQDFILQNARHMQIDKLLKQDTLIDAVREVVPQLWDMLWSTAALIISTLSSLFAIIYLFLLLLDYETYSEGWIDFIPRKRRPFAKQLMNDIGRGMSGYFRGQVLIALCNCVLFSLGFWCIGLPLPFVLGVFIGIISFIPYIQLIGFIPAFLLCILKSADTNENLWLLMGGVLLVYAVIQIIQDVIITPRIMGHIMGLPAAVVLLALTGWGYMLGVIGLIIALPATTLIISYYRRYVIEE